MNNTTKIYFINLNDNNTKPSTSNRTRTRTSSKSTPTSRKSTPTSRKSTPISSNYITTSSTSTPTSSISTPTHKELTPFFESQDGAFCGAHAINNLLRNELVIYNLKQKDKNKSKINMNNIALNLQQELIKTIGNNTFGNNTAMCNESGNYNITVLQTAIELLGYEYNNIPSYYSVLKELNNQKLIGFIFNTGGHYIALRVKPLINPSEFKCDLNKRKQNKTKWNILIIDSIDSIDSINGMRCTEVDKFFKKYMNTNGNWHEGCGCISVLEK